MNPETSPSEPDERESRITALLLGELAPAEADVLRQELARDPELARLRDRLQRTMALVREAAAQPAEPASGTSAPVQLSPKRREKLLRHLKGIRQPPFLERTRTELRWLAPMALAATVVAVLSLPVLLPSLATAKSKSQSVAAAARHRQLELAYETRVTNVMKAAEAFDGVQRGINALVENALQPAPDAAPPPPAAVASAPAARSSGKLDSRPMMDTRMLMRYGLLPKGMRVAPEPGGQPPPPAVAATTAPESAGQEVASAPTQPSKTSARAPEGRAAAGVNRGQVYLPQIQTAWGDHDKDGDLLVLPTGGLREKPAPAQAQPSATDLFATTSDFSWHESQAAAATGKPAFQGQPRPATERYFFDSLDASSVYSNSGDGSFHKGDVAGRLGGLAGGGGMGGMGAVGGPGGAAGFGGMGGGAYGITTGSGVIADNMADFGQAPVESESLSRDLAAATPEGRLTGYDAWNLQDDKTAPALSPARGATALSTLSRSSSSGREQPSAEARGRTAAPAAGLQPAVKAGAATQEGTVRLNTIAQEVVPTLGDTPVLGTEFRRDLSEETLARVPAPPAPTADVAKYRARPAKPQTPPPTEPAAHGVPALSLPVGGAAPGAPVPVAVRELDTALTPPPAVQLQIANGVKAPLSQATVQPTDRLETLHERAAQAGDALDAAKKLAVAGRPMSVTPQLSGLSKSEEKAKVTELAEVAAPPADAALAVVRTPPPEPQPEVPATENPFSTFSLNVTDVSFKLADATLEKGALPDPGGIRSEEFINAFSYCDPEPAPGMPVGFVWERAQYPFAHDRELLRFSIRTAARGREGARPLNLVLLLDNSGSMERADRVQIIREALAVLAGQLQPQDRISVVAFARTARLWVDALSGAQASELVDRVGNLSPEGGTNLEDALNLAYATARRHFLARGINRVVLLTDGAANLGEVNPAQLKATVEEHRRRGIALDCFGIGWEGYNDDLLEVLSRNGDGRYGFVNTPEEAAADLAGQLAGALQVAAADVKVQIEFNPRRTSLWRQIGYAKHQLTKEQFRDNTVDAAELGAAESGNALYVVQVNPQGTGPLAILRVRFREPATGLYRELEWPVPYTGPATPLEQTSPALRLAAVSAAFSEWLATSPFAGEVTPDRLLTLLRGAPEAFDPDPRPKKLEWMIRQAKSISGR